MGFVLSSPLVWSGRRRKRPLPAMPSAYVPIRLVRTASASSLILIWDAVERVLTAAAFFADEPEQEEEKSDSDFSDTL